MADSADLYHCLQGHHALLNLVGFAIYPLVAPQDVEQPFVVYTPLGETRYPSQGCPIPDGFPAYQIDVYAKTVSMVDSIKREILSALSASPVFIPRIISEQGITFENGAELFRYSADFRLW